MKRNFRNMILTAMLAAVMCMTTSCSAIKSAMTVMTETANQKAGGQSFAEAHDAFQTTLAKEENDDGEIPAPPEGVFDLIKYPSKVGDLAAYVSSDPGDGQKHPLIIWVVGGWGNGIDDFPWCQDKNK